VYGYDSFLGFPDISHEKDSFEEFGRLLEDGLITEDLYEDVIKAKTLRSMIFGSYNVQSASSSGDFSNTSLVQLRSKIEFLGLDNIELIVGPFSETMKGPQPFEKLFTVLIDCDLYESYMSTFALIQPLLSSQAYVCLDEYYSLKFPGARRATHEFLETSSLEYDLVMKKSSDGFERWGIKVK